MLIPLYPKQWAVHHGSGWGGRALADYHSGTMWPCLETYLVVPTAVAIGGGDLVGQSQGCGSHTKHRTALPNKKLSLNDWETVPPKEKRKANGTKQKNPAKTRRDHESPPTKTFPILQEPPTLDACGVDITWTVLGLTPFAFGRL